MSDFALVASHFSWFVMSDFSISIRPLSSKVGTCFCGAFGFESNQIKARFLFLLHALAFQINANDI
jgi:hypothetical protein